ncbi:MAG: GIY-YIG nuclease family protein [Alphaproteobacteria bacterium]
MPIPFEATRSYVYRAARYEIIPQIVEIAKNFNDQPFVLKEISDKLLLEIYTFEQLEVRVRKAQSDRYETILQIFRFYIPFLAKNLQVFENLGKGIFKNISLEDELAEAEATAVDIETDDIGIIYAYSFPSIIKDDGKEFPIKIGLTTTGDAEARVKQQCKATSCFEFPQIIGTWPVQRVAAMEDAIHSILEARGKKLNAPGTEWFGTTMDEIVSVIRFIQPSSQ